MVNAFRYQGIGSAPLLGPQLVSATTVFTVRAVFQAGMRFGLFYYTIYYTIVSSEA